MSRVFDRPITILKLDELTEKYLPVYNLHASINKAKANSEYVNAGAIQGKLNLMFEVRYFEDLKDISLNTQSYRILYDGTQYDITDYDDFMLLHKTVKLLGVSCYV